METPQPEAPPDQITWKNRLLRWAVVLFVAGGILLIPLPEGVDPKSWRLLAIFAATITGSIVQPIPGAAVVLLGVTALALFNVLSIKDALNGYADPVVWLVLAAFFISRGMIKTGLGRRIAFLFIKAIGRHSLGLAYALGSTETVLATVIPSNRRPFRWNYFSDCEKSCGSLRIAARSNRTPAGCVSDDECVPM